jgi:hypothetical protein
MAIVVTTPTGHVGSRVVRLLLQAGVRPRVLVRDPARLDAAFVREATAGARTVFWVDPTPPAACPNKHLGHPTRSPFKRAAPIAFRVQIWPMGDRCGAELCFCLSSGSGGVWIKNGMRGASVEASERGVRHPSGALETG